jgi:hypothetical protein
MTLTDACLFHFIVLAMQVYPGASKLLQTWRSDRAGCIVITNCKSPTSNCQYKGPKIFFYWHAFCSNCKIDRRDTEKTNDIHVAPHFHIRAYNKAEAGVIAFFR